MRGRKDASPSRWMAGKFEHGNGSPMMATVCCSIVLFQAVFSPLHSMAWLGVFALQLGCSVLISLSAVFGSAALVTSFCIFHLLPMHIISSEFVIFPAIGILAYSVPHAWSVAVVFVIGLTYVHGPWNEDGHGVTDSIILAVLCCIAMLVGIALQQKDELRLQQELLYHKKQAQTELDELKAKQYLAKQIHDSVTRELSSISMLSWQWADAAENDSDMHRAMKQVYDNAQSALNNVHHVVDLLKDDKPRNDSGDGSVNGDGAVDDNGDGDSHNIAAIRSLVRGEQESIASLGYRGDTIVQGDVTGIDADAMALALDFIKELYANIIRHAIAGVDSFMISIAIADAGISVTQTNAISPANGDDSPFSGVRHGLGLQAHKAAIESAGGSVRYRMENNDWFIHAVIPVRIRTDSEDESEDARGK